MLLVLGLLLWAVMAALGPPGKAHATAPAAGAEVGAARPSDAGTGAGRAVGGGSDRADANAGPTARTSAPGLSSAIGVWPLPPPVLRAFDPPPVRWAPGHRGVDLAAGAGQVVRSALPGTITFTGEIAGTQVTVVTHPGTGTPPLRTTYEPVAAILPVGASVAAGQPIGVVTGALPGRHCESCLHWGLLRGDRYLDPLSLLGLGRVRLLPLSG